MYLLDSSIVSNYLDRRRNFPQLVEQILSTPPEQIFISIITVEEIIQGALASIQRVRQKSSITDAYRYFEELFAALHYFQRLPYTSEAEEIYQSLSAKVKGLSHCCCCSIKRIYFSDGKCG